MVGDDYELVRPPADEPTEISPARPGPGAPPGGRARAAWWGGRILETDVLLVGS